MRKVIRVGGAEGIFAKFSGSLRTPNDVGRYDPAMQSERSDRVRDANESPLPPDRAFVVQLRRQAAPDAEVFIGRVEHIASGQVARFDSAAELVTFIARVGAGSRIPE